MTVNDHQVAAACFARRGGKLRRMTGGWYYAVLMLVLPLASFAITWAIFAQGVPRDLPVAVVDADQSALSRQLTRMVDATPSLRVAAQAPSLEAGRGLVLRNQAYAVIVISRPDMERDARRGEAPKVVAYYNAQYLLPASLIRRDLRAAVGTRLGGPRAAGAPGDAASRRTRALAHIEPIRVDSHTLFNPQLNYLYYLVAALLPTLLQIFIVVGRRPRARRGAQGGHGGRVDGRGGRERVAGGRRQTAALRAPLLRPRACSCSSCSSGSWACR